MIWCTKMKIKNNPKNAFEQKKKKPRVEFTPNQSSNNWFQEKNKQRNYLSNS